MKQDAAIRRTATEVIREFINEGKMFTAFEVSLAAKAKGIQERHRNMRSLVHELIFEIGGPVGYTRTLRDVGAPEQAWVYHRPEDNPYRYQPLPRPGESPLAKPSKDLPKGIRKPVRLQRGTQPVDLVPAGAFGTDQDGKLCIPSAMLAQMGVKPGDQVETECIIDSEKIILRRGEGAPATSEGNYVVEADGKVRLTQDILKVAGIDQLQCYFVEGNASQIEISRFDWS